MNSKEYNFLISDFHLRGNNKMDKEIPHVQKLSQLVYPTLLCLCYHSYDYFAVWTSYKLFKWEAVCKKTSSLQGIVRPPIGWQ
jgi:hypothetical protein